MAFKVGDVVVFKDYYDLPRIWVVLSSDAACTVLRCREEEDGIYRGTTETKFLMHVSDLSPLEQAVYGVTNEDSK